MFLNSRSQVFQEAREEVHSEALIITATVWSSPTVWMDFSRVSMKLLNGILGFFDLFVHIALLFALFVHIALQYQ